MRPSSNLEEKIPYAYLRDWLISMKAKAHSSLTLCLLGFLDPLFTRGEGEVHWTPIHFY